ncbi:transketolase [Sphaerisporangium siamense]|uniref:Transketolase n=1 Tax=Sphaerisporangium siamense TaxID=795645 RepID=A0A7W7D6Z6_9ACTN|nr:transketolase C-terminal domain-containing protein [Sphaerisporangium siamense]MBB4701444.1 transketolase [Sphaerisporangium siamense]GII85567.1 transketolase [Sphaerisporangium siamense]
MSATATRTAYRDALVARMALDPAAVCLDTDTGLFSGVDFGDAAARYLNLGIAEHTLMGVAAGMAASGWRPYVNTMAAFAGARALEAVKIDIAYNALPVRVMATHAGVSAGHLGPTHHALEDVAVMRTLPNMTVVVPADADSTVALLAQVAELPGPAYVRLGRKPTPSLPDGTPPPVLGTIQRLRAGEEIVLVAAGPLPVLAALGAAEALAEDGLDAGVLHAHTLKPFDAETLVAATGHARLVVTVEEHWPAGGLGSAVAEELAERAPRPLLRIAMPDRFVDTVGGQEHIVAEHGITPAGVAARVRARLTATDLP